MTWLSIILIKKLRKNSYKITFSKEQAKQIWQMMLRIELRAQLIQWKRVMIQILQIILVASMLPSSKGLQFMMVQMCKRQDLRHPAQIYSSIGMSEENRTTLIVPSNQALCLYLLTETVWSIVAKDLMVVRRVYIDHNNKQIKLFKEESWIIIKLENQLVKEPMLLYTFATTRFPCVNLPSKYIRKLNWTIQWKEKLFNVKSWL